MTPTSTDSKQAQRGFPAKALAALPKEQRAALAGLLADEKEAKP